MNYEIVSESGLRVSASDHGAELQSIHLGDTEYLWQGDPTYWKGRSPILFPYVGRFFDGKYRLGDKEYDLKIHGFANVSDYKAEKEDSRVTFTLTDSEETLKHYPFHFVFKVIYTVAGQTLSIRFHVENRSQEMMPFGAGGHPAFNVPLKEGLDFTDYYLEFGGRCQPDRIIMTDSVLVSGKEEPYPLEDGRILRLHHDLFDNDAVVLENMADSVTLKTDKDDRSVTVTYPDMRNIGFWHRNKSDAPYVAIEPWYSLPSRQDVVEDLRYKKDLVRLPKGETWETEWTVTVR